MPNIPPMMPAASMPWATLRPNRVPLAKLSPVQRVGVPAGPGEKLHPFLADHHALAIALPNL